MLAASSTFDMPGDFIELVSALNSLPKGVGGNSGVLLQERRKRARTRLHWPLLLFRERSGSAAIESVSRDLSSSGFFCLTRVELIVGEKLVCSSKSQRMIQMASIWNVRWNVRCRCCASFRRKRAVHLV